MPKNDKIVEVEIMPRYLLLAFFVATWCIAFMAGNLFAGEPDASPQKFQTPQDSLTSILKEAAQKSSIDTKLSSTNQGTKLKSARHETSKKFASHRKTSKKFASHRKTSKKFAYAGKQHKKHKRAYSRSKLHKTYNHKTRTARKSL